MLFLVYTSSVIIVILLLIVQHFVFRDLVLSLNLDQSLLIIVWSSWYLIFVILGLAPMLLAMRRTKQPWESLGLSRANLDKVLAFSVIICTTYFFAQSIRLLSEGLLFFGYPLAYTLHYLVFSIIMGPAFFFLFFGYLHTRFASFLHGFTSIFVTALLYAPIAIPLLLPQAILGYSTTEQLLFGVAWGWSSGFVFGFIKKTSGSIIPLIGLNIVMDLIFVAWA